MRWEGPKLPGSDNRICGEMKEKKDRVMTNLGPLEKQPPPKGKRKNRLGTRCKHIKRQDSRKRSTLGGDCTKLSKRSGSKKKPDEG